ncbi:MAG: type II secretion system protein [Chloroflexi bacterium]|nr:type II secretion system protein [Chloroflexota bacterium]
MFFFKLGNLFHPSRNIRRLLRDKSGVTLLETLVALAILSLVVVAFLSGLSTTSRATIISDEQATAESLAKSEIEHIKSQTYINFSVPGHGEYQSVTAPASYSIAATVSPINATTGQPLPAGQDNGIQKITVTINRNGSPVLTIEDYKVNR